MRAHARDGVDTTTMMSCGGQVFPVDRDVPMVIPASVGCRGCVNPCFACRSCMFICASLSVQYADFIVFSTFLVLILRCVSGFQLGVL